MAETPREESPALRCSVLVVARNCAGPLGRALVALERSSPREAIEIIVVDNGSRDGTGQLDAGFPAASFLRLPKNFGYTKAANIGIRGAKGDYVLLLPATVEVAPDTIVRLAARLEAEPELGAVCPCPRGPTLCRRPNSSMANGREPLSPKSRWMRAREPSRSVMYATRPS